MLKFLLRSSVLMKLAIVYRSSGMIILIFGTTGQFWVTKKKLNSIFEIFAIKICEIRSISKIFKHFFYSME